MFSLNGTKLIGRNAQRGGAIVETLPLALFFFLLLFTVIDATLLVWSFNATAFLAAEGARYASVRGNKAAEDVKHTDAPATPKKISDYLNLNYGFLKPSPTVTAIWPEGQDPGSPVTVTVTYQFSALPFLENLLSMPVSSSATTTIVY